MSLYIACTIYAIMLRQLLFTLVTVISFGIYSQDQPKIDSLLSLAESIRYSDPPAADSLYKIALLESQQADYMVGIATAYKGLGVAADLRGDYQGSIYYYEKSYDAYISINDSLGAYKCRFNAGLIYRGEGFYQQANTSFNEAYDVFEKYGFAPGMILCKMNLGITFFEQEDYTTALQIFLESKALTEKVGYIDLNVYGNLGNAYYMLKQKDSAQFYLQKAYAIGKENNNAWGMANYGISLGLLYQDNKQFAEAITILTEVRDLSLQFGLTENLIKISKALSRCFAEEGDFENAYNNLKTSTEILDSIRNAEFFMELETKEEFIKNQKSQGEIALLKEQEKASQLENERKDMINKGLSGGGILILIIAALLFFQSKKRRQLNHALQDKNEQIKGQHKEIMDSIAYAKRIQSAVLPPDKLVKTYLKDSFILYKPKDVVAGDFYWLEKSDDTILFAACDCTGHGVPGAMVSVICNNALNRSVREHGITLPGQILDKARDIVVQEFEKSEDEVKDGMDISLCALKGDQLQFSGAHSPLWIIRDSEIIEFKGDNQPVGKFDAPKPFTTHSFQLKKNDAVYLFSDGYVDQFGGDKGKKFKARTLKDLLLSIQDLSMEAQQKKLDDAFEKWRGDLEQVDDVCVIGVRV